MRAFRKKLQSVTRNPIREDFSQNRSKIQSKTTSKKVKTRSRSKKSQNYGQQMNIPLSNITNSKNLNFLNIKTPQSDSRSKNSAKTSQSSQVSGQREPLNKEIQDATIYIERQISESRNSSSSRFRRTDRSTITHTFNKTQNGGYKSSKIQINMALNETQDADYMDLISRIPSPSVQYSNLNLHTAQKTTPSNMNNTTPDSKQAGEIGGNFDEEITDYTAEYKLYQGEGENMDSEGDQDSQLRRLESFSSQVKSVSFQKVNSHTNFNSETPLQPIHPETDSSTSNPFHSKVYESPPLQNNHVHSGSNQTTDSEIEKEKEGNRYSNQANYANNGNHTSSGGSEFHSMSGNISKIGNYDLNNNNLHQQEEGGRDQHHLSNYDYSQNQVSRGRFIEIKSNENFPILEQDSDDDIINHNYHHNSGQKMGTVPELSKNGGVGDHNHYVNSTPSLNIRPAQSIEELKKAASGAKGEIDFEAYFEQNIKSKYIQGDNPEISFSKKTENVKPAKRHKRKHFDSKKGKNTSSNYVRANYHKTSQHKKEKSIRSGLVDQLLELELSKEDLTKYPGQAREKRRLSKGGGGLGGSKVSEGSLASKSRSRHAECKIDMKNSYSLLGDAGNPFSQTQKIRRNSKGSVKRAKREKKISKSNTKKSGHSRNKSYMDMRSKNLSRKLSTTSFTDNNASKSKLKNKRNAVKVENMLKIQKMKTKKSSKVLLNKVTTSNRTIIDSESELPDMPEELEYFHINFESLDMSCKPIREKIRVILDPVVSPDSQDLDSSQQQPLIEEGNDNYHNQNAYLDSSSIRKGSALLQDSTSRRNRRKNKSPGTLHNSSQDDNGYFDMSSSINYANMQDGELSKRSYRNNSIAHSKEKKGGRATRHRLQKSKGSKEDWGDKYHFNHYIKNIDPEECNRSKSRIYQSRVNSRTGSQAYLDRSISGSINGRRGHPDHSRMSSMDVSSFIVKKDTRSSAKLKLQYGDDNLPLKDLRIRVNPDSINQVLNCMIFNTFNEEIEKFNHQYKLDNDSSVSPLKQMPNNGMIYSYGDNSTQFMTDDARNRSSNSKSRSQSRVGIKKKLVGNQQRIEIEKPSLISSKIKSPNAKRLHKIVSEHSSTCGGHTMVIPHTFGYEGSDMNYNVSPCPRFRDTPSKLKLVPINDSIEGEIGYNQHQESSHSKKTTPLKHRSRAGSRPGQEIHP